MTRRSSRTRGTQSVRHFFRILSEAKSKAVVGVSVSVSVRALQGAEACFSVDVQDRQCSNHSNQCNKKDLFSVFSNH